MEQLLSEEEIENLISHISTPIYKEENKCLHCKDTESAYEELVEENRILKKLLKKYL